jgi:hypothetical protein
LLLVVVVAEKLLTEIVAQMETPTSFQCMADQVVVELAVETLCLVCHTQVKDIAVVKEFIAHQITVEVLVVAQVELVEMAQVPLVELVVLEAPHIQHGYLQQHLV